MAAATTATAVDTLIIGAGMSGLACASRLYQHPHYRDHKKSLLVLEARDRIGGRIESVHVNGHRLDTGANWIHGTGTEDRPNPLVAILPHKRCRALSGSVIFKAPSQGDGSGSDGRVVPANIAGAMAASLWGMIEDLHEAATDCDEGKARQTTMLRAVGDSEERREAFREIPGEYHRTLGSLPQFLENMEAAPLDGPNPMSLLEFGLNDFDGEQVFVQDGYTAVVEEVAKELLQDGLIHLGVKVKQINWSEEDVVQVETGDGKVYTAKQVVCTLPLGVLQHHHHHEDELFEPPLPTAKRAAVQSLGYGTLDKVFLVFQHPWWINEPYRSILKKGLVRMPSSLSPDEDQGAPPDQIMGFTLDLPGLCIHEDGTTTTEGAPAVLSAVNIHNLTGAPALAFFVSCANAAHIEAMTDSQAGALVHRALTSWLGQEIPHPESVHVTRWAGDEFARGSYSHMVTDVSETSHRDEFAQPVIQWERAVLRFAGEHTSRDHFATVHGALLSGWREADAILSEGEEDEAVTSA